MPVSIRSISFPLSLSPNKEAVLFEAIIKQHLNRQGYLLYRSVLPFSVDVSDPNYQLSHNSADLPAWHAHWMAALAMMLAVEGPSSEVEDLLHSSVKAVASTLGALGDFYARIGRENAFGHYSDDQAIYTNAFTLFLNTDGTDYWVMRDVEYALRKMWQFLRYSRKSYMTFIQALFTGVSEEEREQALETLRMFPDDKQLIANLEFEDTYSVQPIANQYINSHYWKAEYFRKAILTDASERIDVEHSCQDYLFVYWMGRYFDLISEQEANALVRWRVLWEIESLPTGTILIRGLNTL